MKKLEGNSHYQNYNAHYIPVISIDPTNKKCKIYYPCTSEQEPSLDEIVVFYPLQTLARFWVELEVTLLKSPFRFIETIGEFLNEILKLLYNPEIQQYLDLFEYLSTKATILFAVNPNAPLDLENLIFYQKITKLMNNTNKPSLVGTQQLIPPCSAPQIPSFKPHSNYGAKFIEISNKLFRLENPREDFIFNYYMQPKNSQKLNLLVNHFNLKNDTNDFPMKAINWINTQEKTTLMEIIKTISHKTWLNPNNYKGDTTEENYVIFYLATTFTIWQEGNDLTNPHWRIMDPSSMIFLFQQTIHIANARLYPSKKATKVKNS